MPSGGIERSVGRAQGQTQETLQGQDCSWPQNPPDIQGAAVLGWEATKGKL